jgi:hypothetical protein
MFENYSREMTLIFTEMWLKFRQILSQNHLIVLLYTLVVLGLIHSLNMPLAERRGGSSSPLARLGAKLSNHGYRS